MTTPPPAPQRVRKRNPHIVWLIVLGCVAAALAVAHWWTANDGPIPAVFVGNVIDGSWAKLPNIGLFGWAWFYAGAAALCWISAVVVHAVSRRRRAVRAPASPGIERPSCRAGAH